MTSRVELRALKCQEHCFCCYRFFLSTFEKYPFHVLDLARVPLEWLVEGNFTLKHERHVCHVARVTLEWLVEDSEHPGKMVH
jgi:hypothetical protein